MMSDTVTKVAVIGGGPAGYSAALRASKLGASVTLIEKGRVGVACLNRACIPAKTLLHSLALFRTINNANRFGINTGQAAIDIENLRQRKDSVISIMASGIAQLMDENGVRVIQGKACLRSPNGIEITGDNGIFQTFKSDKIIIATGSVPHRLNVPGADNSSLLYSGDILELRHIPQSLIMIGGGVAGVELASILNGLGCKVSIIEMMPHILGGEDAEITQILEGTLKKDGIQIYTSAQIDRTETLADVKRVHFRCGEVGKTLETKAVCVAVGQKPFFEELCLPACGVRCGNKGIEVDAHMRTSVPGIFAAGDVTGNHILAHVAMAEGQVAAENALGSDSIMDYYAVPHCIYTSFELASVGLTESEALSKGIRIICLRSNMAANASATIQGERQGMVKIVAARDDGRVLGVHIAGRDASNLIAECALAIKLHATAGDLARTFHPHPTLSEAVWEAATGMDI
jgi:dihydrolipoamide dehydrogenase